MFRVLVLTPALAACTSLAGLDGLRFEDTSAQASGANGTTGGPGGAAQGGAAQGGAAQGGAAQGGAVPGTMVDVGGYSIDATEVTNAAYAAWLATGPSIVGQPAECGFNLDYTPLSSWPSGVGEDNLPVTFVDWCDASAYCSAQGKRLCGKIGGGPNGFADLEIGDVNLSQWYRVCSNALGTPFPYGSGDQPLTCVGNGYDGIGGVQATDERQSVGAAVACHGIASPYDGVFDMSGNVFEWTDECDFATGARDKCHRRGGSFTSDSNGLKCNDNSFSTREQATALIGFRCCT